jgi:hypothetical protein
MLPRQDQEACVVGDQVQAVVLIAQIPADPAVTGCTLPSRGTKAQQRQPLLTPSGHVPEGVANLGKRSEVMMGLKKRLKACFLRYRHRPKDDLAKVHAQRPWLLGVDVRYTLACAVCPERQLTSYFNG